ncbi:MAG: DUF4962 domain-containing protein [Prolixibacteraceae bacterium]|jgi:hypothetical protein|nr:DUF4962 domain-containing protein [Prolixibacteraceae bacterium]MBT7000460.1 DUF4962 domain-containing protein [Prolixibacteraceae bacterium]MBT7397247.1 DUF4962 domain-containing protein [Prolixibacteraceae bacterium]
MRLILKLIPSIFALSFAACQTPKEPINSNGEITVNSEVIYPKYRVWTTPSSGEEPEFNSPSIEWPSGRKAKYDVRLSSAIDFSENLIEKNEIPFAIFYPHQKLGEGMWYWQYRKSGEEWNPIDSFKITSATKEFVTPNLDKILNNVSSNHPRVFAKKNELNELRTRAKNYKETIAILEEADKMLTQIPPTEQSALPAHKGENKYEDSMIAQTASRALGWKVLSALNALSQAYTLTGDIRYFRAAKKWMGEVADWDPNGITHLSNFGDSGIMTSLALAVDTFWDLLTAAEREKMINQSATRANNFYNLWIGKVESRSSSMHVWQHILHQMFQTSMALSGETPEADKWIEYIYELWIAQFPKMGESDGAWFNGIGYFGMNTLTIYDMSSSLSELAGVDFQWSDWFRNNPKWLMYAFPPNSVGDGFGNDGDKYWYPTMKYAGFTDAAARLFNSPYAAWYSKEVAKGLNQEIAGEAEFRWFRIQRTNKRPLPEISEKFDFPQAAHFPDVGVAYMHTSLHKVEDNLMLSATSSPFGAMGHAHAEQNNFNIAFGGKRLFYNSGYRPKMADPHHQGWHKHTRGHNGILIDGEGQPFDAGAYGWMPRFLHGKQISYAVGDASNAYSASDLQSLDLGMKRFRRHYIMLRPSTIVIYDELEADHPAEWTWLLHNDLGLKTDSEAKTIIAENEFANAQVSLYSSTDIEFNVTDTFSIPARNWNRKVDQDGNIIDFVDQWHFSGIIKEKTPKMRYLAIIQVKPKSGASVCEEVIFDEQSKTYSVNGWNITAEMDELQPAKIEVSNCDGTAAFTSADALEFIGKMYKGTVTGSSKLVEIIDGKTVFKETVDEVPEAIKKIMERD